MANKETIRERLRRARYEFNLYASPGFVILLAMSWPFFVVNAFDTGKRRDAPKEVARDKCVHCKNKKDEKEEALNIAFFFDTPIDDGEKGTTP